MDEVSAHRGSYVEPMKELDDDGALYHVDGSVWKVLGNQGIDEGWEKMTLICKE